MPPFQQTPNLLMPVASANIPKPFTHTAVDKQDPPGMLSMTTAENLGENYENV